MVGTREDTMRHNGLPGPLTGSPPRVPGAVRRTSTVDLLRPGPSGDPEVRGRARDVRTPAEAADPAATPEVLASALTRLRIVEGRVVDLQAHPAPEGLPTLLGRPALVGWRTGLWRFLREDYEAATALHRLLDDVPGMMVIGGFSGSQPRPPTPDGSTREPRRRIDVCAGWAAESRAALVLSETGVPPAPVTPAAPPLASVDDAAGWHSIPALPVAGMSRRRRLDVLVDGDVWHIDAMFRDTFVEPDGAERVLHEYGVRAEAAAGSGRLLTLRAEPRVLPHRECPAAVASARMMLGVPVAELRERVSADLFGPASCTHLNDLLRTLADVPGLAAQAG